MDFSFDSFDWFYSGFAWVLIKIHSGLGTFLDPNGGVAWALTIVVMTVLVRLLVFPLFVKQIRSQRAMAVLQPKLKELQQKYKDDKQKLQEEMMKLYRENGANPLSGCLPVIAQFPFLIAMYHVFNAISRTEAKYGMSKELVEGGSQAQIFGVPIGAIFTKPEAIANFGANPTLARVIIMIFVVIMAATTFIAQRQLMIKQTAQQQAAGQSTPFQQQQKIMLFIFPAMFLFWGFFFPMGLIWYWTISNLWTMGQQFWVLHRIPHQAIDDKDKNGSDNTGGTWSKAAANSAPAAATKDGKASNNGSKKGKESASSGGGRTFRRKKAEPEPEPEPEVRVVRNQRTRAPRSKRSGSQSGGQKPSGQKSSGQKSGGGQRAGSAQRKGSGSKKS